MKLEGRWDGATLGSILNGSSAEDVRGPKNCVKQERDIVGTVRKMLLAAKKGMNWKWRAEV